MLFDNNVEYPKSDLELELDEFPGTVFHWKRTRHELTATNADGTFALIPYKQIQSFQNMYLADLNDDGLPEFCVTVDTASGIIRHEIIVYDFAAKKLYKLPLEQEPDNYTLSMKNGELIIIQKERFGKEAVKKVGYLAIFDDKLVIKDSNWNSNYGIVLPYHYYRRILVTLYDSNDTLIQSEILGTNGSYNLIARADTSNKLVITKPGYLSYTIENIILKEDEDMPTIDLNKLHLAGDVNEDGVINAEDLTYLLSEFNKKPVIWEYADIDGNGIVNAVDLTYLLAGFNKKDMVVQWIEE
jgi:hypothetical protein